MKWPHACLYDHIGRNHKDINTSDNRGLLNAYIEVVLNEYLTPSRTASHGSSLSPLSAARVHMPD